MSSRQPNGHPWRHNAHSRRQTLHADFEFRPVTINDRRAVLIVDLDLGGKSVTNDIRWVCERVATQLVRPSDEYDWFYRDSQGCWDRIDPRDLRIHAGPRDGSLERAWKLVTRT